MFINDKGYLLQEMGIRARVDTSGFIKLDRIDLLKTVITSLTIRS